MIQNQASYPTLDTTVTLLFGVLWSIAWVEDGIGDRSRLNAAIFFDGWRASWAVILDHGAGVMEIETIQTKVKDPHSTVGYS